MLENPTRLVAGMSSFGLSQFPVAWVLLHLLHNQALKNLGCALVLYFWRAHHRALSRSDRQTKEGQSSFVTAGSSGKLAQQKAEGSPLYVIRNLLCCCQDALLQGYLELSLAFSKCPQHPTLCPSFYPQQKPVASNRACRSPTVSLLSMQQGTTWL